MIRAQIQFEATLYDQLKQKAKDLGCSIVELARISIQEKFNSDLARQKWADYIKLAVLHRSGLSDLSTNHDKYLSDEEW